jgi:hypothetical protein
MPPASMALSPLLLLAPLGPGAQFVPQASEWAQSCFLPVAMQVSNTANKLWIQEGKSGIWLSNAPSLIKPTSFWAKHRSCAMYEFSQRTITSAGPGKWELERAQGGPRAHRGLVLRMVAQCPPQHRKEVLSVQAILSKDIRVNFRPRHPTHTKRNST